MWVSKGGLRPEPAPSRIRLADGSTRTDPDSFTSDDLASAGFTLVDDPPPYRGDQVLEWSGDQWSVRDMTAEELAASRPARRPLSRFEFMSLLTGDERVALRVRAAAGDHILTDALEMLGLAAAVDLDHPMVGAMLGYVVSNKLMSAERRAEIEAAAEAIARS